MDAFVSRSAGKRVRCADELGAGPVTRVWEHPAKRARLEVFKLFGEPARCGAVVLRSVLCGDLPVGRHPPLRVRGGALASPNRRTAFFSDEASGYAFSGTVIPAQPPTPETKTLLQFVVAWLSRALGTEVRVNGVLLQYYHDPRSGIGAHPDEKKRLLPGDGGVFALSLGASKMFRVRDKASRKVVKEHVTQNAECMWMGGSDFQDVTTHEIPALASHAGKRVSLTFRWHVPDAAAWAKAGEV